MMASQYLDLIHQDHDLHDWSLPLMNNIDYTSNVNEVNLSRLSNTVESPSLNPPLTLSSQMVQDLGFHGTTPHTNLINSEVLQTGFQQRVKDEITQETPNDIHESYYQIIDEKLLLRALQNSTHNIPVPSTEDFVSNNGSRINGCNIFENGGNSYNMVLPTANILGLFPNPLPLLPCILDMDLHAFDLLASTRRDKPLLREDASFRLNEMQEIVHGQQCLNQLKIPSLISGGGVMEYRGMNSTVLENKASQTIQRKSRLESRSPSFSSFKVRKEKLGDRIAALQQLVAPFGKTDTASVLMEAIGYIKFLQDQVETLSVPYLRSSRNKKQRTTQEGSNEEKEEPKLDLRSRGLCLVPLSCTSYVTNENAVVWPSHPNFQGNT